MRRLLFILGAFGMLLVSQAAPVHAQATRTWVSGVGDDANPCSRTAPCKTFAGAISKTATGGEINVLDPGGFGTVTITKSITISSQSFEAGVLAAGTFGITVNTPAATDYVVLEGLDIEGAGTGTIGVNILSGDVVIRRSSIRHFSGNAVNLAGTATSRVLVQDSVIALNSGGVFVNSASGVNNAVIDRTTFDNHTSFAVSVTGPSAMFLSASQLIGSGPKIVVSNGGTVTSYGNNVIRGPGTPTSTLPLQ